MKFLNGIKNKLVFVFTLFIALLLIVIATGTYAYFRHTTRQLIYDQQFSLISSKAHDLDHQITSVHSALIHLAKQVPPDVPANAAASREWMANRKVIINYFSNGITFLDNTGTLVASIPAGPEQPGTSYADRDYFTRSMITGKPCISGPYLSRRSGHPAIMMTAPVMAQDGSIKGVLCGSIDLFEKSGGLFSALKDVKIGSTGYLYLFAPDRTMIMHPDQSRIMAHDVKPGANNLFDQALQGFEGSGETVNSKGRHFLASFKRLDSTGWILAANYPTAEAYRPIMLFRNYYLLGMLFVLLAAVALAWTLGIGIAATEKTLESGLNYFKSLLINNTTGILVVSSERNIEEVNPRLCTMFGYEGSELLGKSAEMLHIDREHFENFSSWFKTALCNNDSPVQVEYRFRRKDGTPFWVAISGIQSQLSNSEGGVVWSLLDITDRKRAEETLLATNRRLEETGYEMSLINTQLEQRRHEAEQIQAKLQKLSRAVENSPESIVITDRQGIIEYVNPKFTELTGYLPEEAIGQNPKILKADGQPKELYEELWRTICAGKVWSGDLCNRKKNGEIFWEHASISAISDDQGHITHFVGIKQDVTEERRIAKDLGVALLVAEQATRAKSEFLANMSHEIRTPLTSIIGFSDLALQSRQQSYQQECIRKISIAGAALLHLVNDVLDFSKIEAGELQMDMAPFYLDELVADVAAVLQHAAVDKGLTLTATCPKGCFLLGDAHRLGQVITNLLSNAIKFTEQGSISLMVTLMEQQADKIRFMFSVSDSGIGIAEENVDKVFNSFTQADGSTSRKYGGTGLGLSISKELVEMMGGEISCTSSPGQGSTFSFALWLNIGDPSVAADGSGGSVAGDGTGQLCDFSGIRILVADDNEINRELVVDLLSETGADIDAAADGKEALEKVIGGGLPYDLVLMDIQMPVMDGYEATRLIRADSRFADLPIIALTGNALVEEQQRTKASGMSGFLPKPYSVPLLLKTIRLYLDRPESENLPDFSRKKVEPDADVIKIPKIPGLDMAAALDGMDGNKSLYLSILRTFVDYEADAGVIIERALSEQNRDLAERTAHSIKGSAAAIGALVLRNAARLLENAIRNNDPEEIVSQLAARFGKELDTLVQVLMLRLPGMTTRKVDAVLDRAALAPVLSGLARYLAENDTRAEHYLDTYEHVLSGLPETELAQLRKLLASFDFEAAHEALSALAEKAGITLDGEPRV